MLQTRPLFNTAYLAEVGHVAEAMQDTEEGFIDALLSDVSIR